MSTPRNGWMVGPLDARLAAMFNLDQCHALLVAERSRDVVTISEAISTVLVASPKLTLLDIEQVFREFRLAHLSDR